MDTVTPDDITCRLRHFATAVKETRTHAAERSAFGRYRAGAPYFALYPLRRLMASGETEARCSPEHHAEFGRISRDLAALEEESGSAYRKELFSDLFVYTEAYRTLFCYHELGMCSLAGIARDPLREEIAVLLAELEGEFPLEEIRALVAGLDETLCLLHRSSSSGIPRADPAGGAAGEAPSPYGESIPAFHRPRERTGSL